MTATAQPLYDTIGRGYAVRRVPDPRIGRRLLDALDGMATVLNVGAGAGSYEPADRPVVAVEPSGEMIAQRAIRTNVVRARAEALPFPDASFDAVMGVLTVHHWTDCAGGLRECLRVARRRVAILTWDPMRFDFWLVRDYFPDLLALDRVICPTIEEMAEMLGPISVLPLPVPADCVDGFMGAYWRRPEAYLDPAVRAAISSFARIDDVEPRIERLRRDLASGEWARRNASILHADELDVGYRILIADRQ